MQDELKDQFEAREKPQAIKPVDTNIIEKTSEKAKKEIIKKNDVSKTQLSKKKIETKVEEVKAQVKLTKPQEQVKPIIKIDHALWKKFNNTYLQFNEEMDIGISYMGLNAASIKLQTSKALKEISGQEVYQFSAIAKTASFYRWVYELDDHVTSYVEKSRFIPLKYSLVQRESLKNIDHIELYDRKKLKTYFRYKRVKKKTGKANYRKLDAKIPEYSQDFLSVFYFLRGLPLEINQKYVIPITSKGKTWNMLVKPLKKEVQKVGKFGKVPSIKIELVMKYSGDLAKKGSVFFWISDDKYRRLMKVRAEVKIGAIKGELLKYRVDGQEILK